ncbi:hypothetical protein, partial [Archangium sp.]|uniref:hypothetical protein n=1 Tax=Archangium sp. TaxID=1872627 RepID=UPI002E3165FE
MLENIWSDDLADSTSVRPFLEGWAASLDVRVGFRSYHGRDDLVHWLSEFWSAKSNPWICYIAGHTSGNRLSGLTSNINLTQAFSSAIPRKPGPQLDVGPNPKGVLLGTCVVGGRAKRLELLESTANSLQWVAGYEKVVPWMESTLCELLFLTPPYSPEGLEGDRKRRVTRLTSRVVEGCCSDNHHQTAGGASWVKS